MLLFNLLHTKHNLSLLFDSIAEIVEGDSISFDVAKELIEKGSVCTDRETIDSDDKISWLESSGLGGGVWDSSIDGNSLGDRE